MFLRWHLGLYETQIQGSTNLHNFKLQVRLKIFAWNENILVFLSQQNSDSLLLLFCLSS
jgi:hypothetical protein